MGERAKVEEQLRQSQKMEAVGRLTGGIAHDFNNLLTVVIGSLDLLKRRMKDAEPRQLTLISNAIDGAQRAATLTSRLLAFSRQHPRSTPRCSTPTPRFRACPSLLQRTLDERVRIELKLAEALWTTFVDPNQLENAILNLCVNAVDAMPKGGELTIETANAVLDPAYCAHHADLVPGEYAMVAVTDTGTGMTPDVVGARVRAVLHHQAGRQGHRPSASVRCTASPGSRAGTRRSSRCRGKAPTIALYMPRRAAEPASEPAQIEPVAEIVTAPRNAKILIVEGRRSRAGLLDPCAARCRLHRRRGGRRGRTGLNGLRLNPDVALLFTDIVLKGADERARARRPGGDPALRPAGPVHHRLHQGGDPPRR